jgi:hypothetical protein
MPVSQQTFGAPVVQPGMQSGISTGQPVQGIFALSTIEIGAGSQQPQHTF